MEKILYIHDNTEGKRWGEVVLLGDHGQVLADVVARGKTPDLTAETIYHFALGELNSYGRQACLDYLQEVKQEQLMEAK